MYTPTSTDLAGLEVTEDEYKIDFSVADRFQLFSSELLKISLLAIAAYSFLVPNFALRTSAGTMSWSASLAARGFLIFATVTLTLAAASAVGQRYFAACSVQHLVREIRLRKRLHHISWRDELTPFYIESGLSPEETAENEKEKERLTTLISAEETTLRGNLSYAARLGVVSVASLITGISCVAVAIAIAVSFA